MKALKVFHITAHLRSKHGWTTNQLEAVVAVPSRAAAARAFGLTIGFVTKFASETGNLEQLEVARSEPGTVFARPVHDWETPYKPFKVEVD